MLKKKVGKFSLLQQARICTFKKTGGKTMSHVLASRYGIPPFFKDKPEANDDMCVCFIDLSFR